jgi:hypothetical protein
MRLITSVVLFAGAIALGIWLYMKLQIVDWLVTTCLIALPLLAYTSGYLASGAFNLDGWFAGLKEEFDKGKVRATEMRKAQEQAQAA